MSLPAIPSLSSAALHTARCCKHCYERSLFLSPRAAPLSLLPHRTPKLSRRWMMCSRHQHKSKPSHDSGTLPQDAVAGEYSAKFTAAFWPYNTGPLHHGQAGREILSYQTSKCQTAFPHQYNGSDFYFSQHRKLHQHSDQEIQEENGTDKKSVKISFLFQIVFPRHLLGSIIVVSLQLYS